MTLGVMQSNFSSILMRKQRPRKVTKLGSGSQEENPNLLIPKRQDSFLLSAGDTHTHRGKLYRKEDYTATTKERARRVDRVTESRKTPPPPAPNTTLKESRKQLEEA